MADSGPSKTDIAAVFKRLRSNPSNKTCFDCNAKNPTWASVTYGVFICIDCSAVHRSLGVHLTFVRSTQLDTNWTWLQLRAMQLGGNANATSFFTQHNCITTDAQQKYNSRAAALYREKLHNMAVNAMRLHGTQLHVDNTPVEVVSSPEKKEVDFFEEHVELELQNNVDDPFEDADSSLGKFSFSKNEDDQSGDVGPNVQLALGTSPTEARMDSSRKPTIGQRKPAATKKGLGGKKGLGAQKVSANFNEIEKEAQLVDQLREKAVIEDKKMQEKVAEDEAQKMASIRLAYQDLTIQKQKEEDKLRSVDPKKASQLERLGMGFGRSGQVAHSAMSDMKTIEQETPNKPSGYSRRERDIFEDDFELVGFTSGPPKYNDSPFSREDKYSPYNGSRNEDKYSAYGSSSSSTNKSSTFESEKKSSFFDEMLAVESDDSHSRSRKGVSVPPPSTSDEAVKKFGNAKSISSEQYFGGGLDADYERKANLARFEGSSSISSSDYFNDERGGGGGGGGRNRNVPPSFNGPDLDDIKEGVRQSVTKVAGRLSNLANGMMNSLQDRYGY